MRNALTFNVNETFSTGDNATKSYKNDVKKDHERKKPMVERGAGNESQRENVSLLSESVVARKESTNKKAARQSEREQKREKYENV